VKENTATFLQPDSLKGFFLDQAWVTPGSRRIATGPNLGDLAQTENAASANENGYQRTERNLRENVYRPCKTFILRFDSDRRLQYMD
jgi:hypothetical protein